jgi:preprotein translocase subunit SecF
MMVAILPVGAILFIGAGLLGAGTLRDLSLALFVGILIGTAATIFIAAPLYAWLRQSELALVKQAERVERRRAESAAKAAASPETATA